MNRTMGDLILACVLPCYRFFVGGTAGLSLVLLVFSGCQDPPARNGNSETSSIQIRKRKEGVSLQKQFRGLSNPDFSFASGYRLHGARKEGSDTNPRWFLDSDLPFIVEPDRLLLSSNGQIRMLNLKTSRELWNRTIPAETQVIRRGERLFFYEPSGRVSAVDLRAGREHWEKSLPTREALLTAGPTFLWIYNHDRAIALRPENGSVHTKKTFLREQEQNREYTARITRLFPLRGAVLLRRRPTTNPRYRIEVYDSQSGNFLFDKLGYIAGGTEKKFYVNSWRNEFFDTVRIPGGEYANSFKLQDASGHFLTVEEGVLYYSAYGESEGNSKGSGRPSGAIEESGAGIVKRSPETGSVRGTIPLSGSSLSNRKFHLNGDLLFITQTTNSRGDNSRGYIVHVINVNREEIVLEAAVASPVVECSAGSSWFLVGTADQTFLFHRSN